MAKGREKHEAYQHALSLLGKDLARRAKSKCELSGESGSLQTVDLAPDDRSPTLDSTLLVQSHIASWLDGAPFDDSEARFLENAIWSEVPAVRTATRRLLQRLVSDWAHDALDSLNGWAPEE